MIVKKNIYTIEGIVGTEAFSASTINEALYMYSTLHHTIEEPKKIEKSGYIYSENGSVDIDKID